GKRKRRTVYGATKAEVQERLRQLQTDAAAGRLSDVGTLTVGQYLQRWLTTKKPTVATHTFIPYERDCNRYLVPYLGGVQLANLPAVRGEKLYPAWAGAGVSPRMRRKAGPPLRVARPPPAPPLPLTPHTPAADVPKPRHEPEDMQVLDPDQVSRFLAAA